MIKILNAVLAIAGGVAGAMVFYYVLNRLVQLLPGKWEQRVKPWVFAGPALLFIGLFLIYPALRTILVSFANARTTAYVGFDNYIDLLSSGEFRAALGNTLLWIVVVPAVVIVFGLAVAVLADRLGSRGEKTVKTLIFMPMAISMVGAGTIWGFIYTFRPEGRPQIGVLNAIVTGLGGSPVSWLQIDTGKLNSVLLMIILVWIQTGFAMVLLSAAIKGVPEETIEAARIDGATEVQTFLRIVVPQIWPTVVTVFVTVLITVLKIFDIVYVTTGGNFGTDIIANAFFRELFTNGNNGRAGAIVVMLMIAIVPVMVYQVRHFRMQEARS
ncbi:carbohydrate ABC transporter permease [Lentzea flaviverrucosa]|uniref:Alpha-glucoside transport system permease protein n=1 Tax=Lentzea flaviverrucosa TaxID=200379 RepID=A0A1H9XSA1_9PSEU|nr:sugar ABC transporter permease [Lentzea flaviverrucosa]RDI19329.1 alpha-glucoside transport system permease protein [Lentzea flaviverrucosa]SES49032.1 alpha-glucoside transport system permease protein [Lentzea flaviverrucosa]